MTDDEYLAEEEQRIQDNQGHPVEEEPVKLFRGVWCPPRLFALLEDGTITQSEFVLILVIDAYHNSKLGCFASNGYLAERIGRGSTQLREALSKLKNLGLIEITYNKHKNKRWIRTPWMREGSANPGKPTRGVPAGRQGSAGIPAPNVYKYNNGNSPNGELHRRSKTSPGGDTFGLSDKNKISTFEQQSLTSSKYLWHAICKLDGMKPHWQPKAQAKYFSALRRKVSNKGEVEQVLHWYCDQLNEGRGHLKAEFIPIAVIPQMFYHKYPAIKDKMEEMTGEEVSPRRSRNPINADTGEEFTDEEMEN